MGDFITGIVLLFLAYIICKSLNEWKIDAIHEGSQEIAELKKDLEKKQDTIDVLRGYKKPKPVDSRIKVGKPKVVTKSRVFDLSNNLYNDVMSGVKRQFGLFPKNLDQLYDESDNWKLISSSDDGTPYFNYSNDNQDIKISYPFKVGEKFVVNMIDSETDTHYLNQNITITSIKTQRLNEIIQENHIIFEVFSLDIVTSGGSKLVFFDPANMGLGEWNSESKFVFYDEVLMINPWTCIIEFDVPYRGPSVEDILKQMQL